MGLMNYLLRDRHGTYYFRRVIPAELRPFMPAPWTGKANWKQSLQTKDPTAAKRAHARLLSRCAADFEEAERTMREGPAKPTLRQGAALPSVAEIEADFLSGLLEEDAAHRSSGDSRRQHQTAAERARWDRLVPLNLAGRGMPPELHEAYRDDLELLAADFANAQARQDPSIVHAELKALLQRTGAAIDPDSPEYYEAGLAILRAHVRAYELKLERQRGKIVASPPPSADRGPKLSEAFEAWRTGSGTRGSRKPSPKTLLEAVYAVRRFTEWHGDARLGDITRAMGREFALALAKVPTGLPDSLRQTPLRELVKREKDLAHLPPVHSGTINKSLNILSAIVSHAEAGGGLDAVPGGFRNPFGKGVKLDTDRREADPRQPFSTADLKSIFGAGVFQTGERPTGGAGEAAFWLPLLALLSGARQGELAQLRVMDLAENAESGVWYLDIGTAGGRSIKTASSQRRVPLHPALVDIGLLRYRAGLVAAGAKPEASLWPALNIEREAQPAGAWSKWFTRFLRKTVGIEDPTKVFHSFRHTFKRMARDAGLHEEMHDALTGHAGGGGVGRGYGRGFGLKAMAAEMARIEAPEAVRDLRWSEAEAGEAPRAARSKNR